MPDDTNRSRERGLSLLELTVILAVIALMAAALAPAALRMIQQARHDGARDDLVALHRAIVGSDADRTWGFVGDVGRLPYDLGELVERGGLPPFVISPTTGVGYGWNGPYINRGRDLDDFRTDPWGHPYEIGRAGFGQLSSAGPNGVFGDADDIVYPPSPMSPYGTLLVSVKGHSGAQVISDPQGCTVTLHYAQEGMAAQVVDEMPPFSFTDVHRGLHAVEATCPRLDGAGFATEMTVVAVVGGGQQATELHVELGGLVGGEGAAGDEREATDEGDGWSQPPAQQR